MSRSNAAAINRRVNVPSAQSSNISKTPVTPSNLQTQPQSQTGLTLPQVISVFDNRLILLEKFMNDAKQNTTNNMSNIVNNVQTLPNTTDVNTSQEKPNYNAVENVSINDFNTIINEFNSRFELFAHEIADLKDIVLKLQSYTMDVNKLLLEDKVNSILLVTNNNLAITNEDSLNTNIENPSEDKKIDCDTTSIDLKSLIKHEFSQSN
jgi:hypothetical protein